MEDKKRINSKKNPLQEKIVTKVGKLLSERSKKASGYSRSYVYEPADFFEKQYGTLYVVLEIASPDPHVFEIGDMIIETLKDEYYADLDRDTLVSFESALKVVNKELSNFAATGKTGWLNKINAICACLSENMLHMTQVGSAEAYLLRGGSLTHISEGLYTPGGKTDPLKTFINIASGTLEPEDKVIISTPGLFYSMSLDNIKKIIDDKSPSKAVKGLAESLKEEEDALGTSLLVIRITTEDQLSNETVEEEDEEIWIAEPKSKLESISEKTKPIFSKSKNFLGKGFKKIKHTGKEKVLPLFGKASSKIKAIRKKDGEGSVSEPMPHKREEPAKPLEEKLVSDEKIEKVPKKETFIKKTEPKLSSEKPFTDRKESAPTDTEKSSKLTSVTGFLKKIGRSIASFFSEVKSGKPEKDKYVYLVIIALVIFLSSIGILYYKQRVNRELARVKNIYNNASDKEKQAEAALIYKDRQRAKTLLNEAYSEAYSIKGNKTYGIKASALMDKIREQLDKTDMVYRIKNPSAMVDFGQDTKTSSLNIIGTDYYSYQENGTTVYRYVQKDKKVTKVNKSLTPGQFQNSTLSSDNTLLLLDNGPGLSEYDPESNSIVPQTISLSGSWEKGNAISVYQGYLYLLSPQNNKIYRHAKTLGGYSIGIDYLSNSNTDLSNALSMTVGETVFVLKSDGKILEFTKGTTIPFSVKDMPTAFEKPNIIFTRSGYVNIYVTDQKRQGVIIIDSKGNYKGQYVSESFKDIKGIFVDEAGKKIYLLSENKVYSIDFILE